MGKTYVDPLSDGGFKLFFGKSGKSNQFLVDFLNGLFEEDKDFDRIVAVEYRNTELSPDHILDKEIRYDVHCLTSTGHRFVVEVQREVRPNFLKRTDFYMAKAIVDQYLEKKEGERWTYMDLQPVVGVFVLEDHLAGKPQESVLDYQYRDKNDPSETLGMTRKIFVQLDYFHQKEEECVSKRDQWLYILKHLDDMEYMPFTETKDKIFAKLDDYARIGNLSKKDRQEYDRLLKFRLDYYSDLRDSVEEGEARGFAKGKAEGERARSIAIAKSLIAGGMSREEALRHTELSSEDLTD